MKLYVSACLVSFWSFALTDAFAPRIPRTPMDAGAGAISRDSSSRLSSATESETSTTSASTEQSVAKLKKVLEREYVSMFDPMQTEYYASDVTFDDPLNNLAGVASYENNVDMLGARTLLGSLLFQDCSIVLHSINGGDVRPDGSISDITTRWTLRFCFKILPWKPTARFTGISIYNVIPGGTEGVLVTKQTDYWDSVNMVPGGGYRPMSKIAALQDFVNQLRPGGVLDAQSAAPEVPYQLLRRGDGYQVRRYPSYSAVTLPYDRRDEGFGVLGAFTTGMNPLSPAIMQVSNDETSDDDNNKIMSWPLSFAAPGQDVAPVPSEAMAKQASDNKQWNKCQVVTIPSQVVAVAEFTDASMEPVVRQADASLRQSLKRDGIQVPEDSEERVMFAQYDAIFSMGKRRGEVWIPLEDGGHPWS